MSQDEVVSSAFHHQLHQLLGVPRKMRELQPWEAFAKAYRSSLAERNPAPLAALRDFLRRRSPAKLAIMCCEPFVPAMNNCHRFILAEILTAAELVDGPVEHLNMDAVEIDDLASPSRFIGNANSGCESGTMDSTVKNPLVVVRQLLNQLEVLEGNSDAANDSRYQRCLNLVKYVHKIELPELNEVMERIVMILSAIHGQSKAAVCARWKLSVTLGAILVATRGRGDINCSHPVVQSLGEYFSFTGDRPDDRARFLKDKADNLHELGTILSSRAVGQWEEEIVRKTASMVAQYRREQEAESAEAERQRLLAPKKKSADKELGGSLW